MKKWMLIAAAATALAALPAAAAPTREFMTKAMQGDNSEVSLGRLAAQRGQSAAVRSFGRMLMRDHAKAKIDAAALARRLHVRVTDAMAPEARAERLKLRRLRGRAFDREFARYMVDDHRKDIAAFEEQVRTGDRATAAMARKQLPTLRHHLDTARSLPS